LEEYERDYSFHGKNILLIQDLSHQVSKLSSLEFDEGKRNELLGLPTIIEKMRLDYEEFFSSFKEEMKNEIQQQQLKIEDQEKKNEDQNKTIQDLRNQLESLSTSNNNKNEERSEEDVRREIDQIISEIDTHKLDEEQLVDYASLNRRFKREELSNEELLEMLDELNQMKLSI